jgi:Domain of unknown function (DUF4160)
MEPRGGTATDEAERGRNPCYEANIGPLEPTGRFELPACRLRDGLPWWALIYKAFAAPDQQFLRHHHRDVLRRGPQGVAHFHAAYAEHRASVALDGRVIAGGLPRRAQELVSEWAALHRAELETNWDLARRGEPLASIAPLP